MDLREHWDAVYRRRVPTEVSWYQAEADLSARTVREFVPDHGAPVIDIGGGASVLVSQLDQAGYTNLTVLDISGAALTAARMRLGAAAGRVRWVEANILEAPLPSAGYQFWHDRAVFHFLVDPAARATYVAQARRAVAPGGLLLVATFAEDGPTRCSGLEVRRYSPEALHAEFGQGFAFVTAHREEHRTPSGAMQAFTYCLCRRAGAPAAGA
jgi:SAM-dependent methyltransferase